MKTASKISTNWSLISDDTAIWNKILIADAHNPTIHIILISIIVNHPKIVIFYCYFNALCTHSSAKVSNPINNVFEERENGWNMRRAIVKSWIFAQNLRKLNWKFQLQNLIYKLNQFGWLFAVKNFSMESL